MTNTFHEELYLLVHITMSGTRYCILQEPIIPDYYKNTIKPGDVVFVIKPIEMICGGHLHQLQNGSDL